MSLPEPTPLLLLGTRLFAEEMADVIAEIPGFRVAGFVENMDRARCERPLLGLPVHWVDDIGGLASTHQVIAALSTTHRSKFVEQAAALGFSFATVVHPSAQVSRSTTIGEGTFINRGVIVAGFTRIGRHVILNRGATVGHHTTLDDYCTIQPGAIIAGACHVEYGVYVGLGARIIDKMKVGSRSLIGAGAVVVKDIPQRVQAVGLPARVVKENFDGK